MRGLLIAVAAGAFLAACATPAPSPVGGGDAGDGPPPNPVDVSDVPQAVPRHEPKSRYGNPASYEVFGTRYYVMDSATDFVERGIASWYGRKFHGRRTSSGEPYDMYEMTAAHKSLPLPTFVRVKNLRNGKEIVVRVNDRGPFAKNRIIDLSYAAASKLDMLGEGTAPVEIRAILPEQGTQPVVADGPLRAVEAVRYYVQLGAFAERGNADRLITEVGTRLKSAVARIEETSGTMGTLYRVRVGPVDSVTEIDKLAAELERLGFREGQVVVEDR